MDRRQFLSSLVKATGVSVALVNLPSIWAATANLPKENEGGLAQYHELVTDLIDILTPLPQNMSAQNVSLYPFVSLLFVKGYSSAQQKNLMAGLDDIAQKCTEKKALRELVEQAFKTVELNALTQPMDTYWQHQQGKVDILSTVLSIRNMALLGLFCHPIVAPIFTDDLFLAGEYQPCVDLCQRP